ncbi:unnamed protein product [Camellia sinensis]
MVAFVWLMLVAYAGLIFPASSQEDNNKSIFILAGQSNMSGRGGVNNGTWDGVVPPQCQPNPAILRLSSELNWEEASEPLHKDIDVNATCGVGPGMVFANTVLDNKNLSLSIGGVVGLVPCAIGGTKISEWARGTYLYNQLVSRASAALQDGGGSIQAVLWYQGESDTVNPDDAALYKGRLERFFMDLRADLQSPLLPIVQTSMDLFRNAKAVRLHSHHDKYLLADDDEDFITQDRNGSAKNARWTVEFVDDDSGRANFLRLKSCFGKYLTASNQPFLLAMTGHKVIQSSPAGRLDSSVALASGQGPYIEKVREAQLGIDLANVKCVDAKGLQLEPDHLHLTTQAQVQLGEMLANAFLQTLPSTTSE